MPKDNESLFPPYEYEERATKFVNAVTNDIFPDLKKEGFHCFAFTHSETLTQGEEEMREVDEMHDTSEEEKEIIRRFRQEDDEADRRLTEEGADYGGVHIEGPHDKRNLLEDVRPKMKEEAANFRGTEHYWILKGKPKPEVYRTKAGEEKWIVLLASYKFKG